MSLLLFGCSGSDDDGAPVGLAGGCDITAADCQQAIFRVTADIRGQPQAPMPPVRTISLEEFAREVEGADSATPEADPWSAVLPLFGLLPEGSSIAEESAAVAVQQVAAYYDGRAKLVTVIDRGESDPVEDMLTLAHEFVHSLQDAAIGLVAFQEGRVSSLDSFIAIRSLVEGEANVLELGVLAKTLNRAPATLNWSSANMALRKGIFETIASSPAPLLAAQSALPYVLGTAQLGPLWLAGGQPAIDALYTAPGSAVLDWAEDTKVTAPSRLEKLDCLPTAGPEGFTGYDSDSFGVTGLFAVALDAGAEVNEAWRKGLQLRADRAVAFQEDGVSNSFAVAWRLRFESAATAKAFASEVSLQLAAGTAVVVQDREVLYLATTNPDKLALWTDANHCGTEEEVPRSQPERNADEAALGGVWRRPKIFDSRFRSRP